MDWASVITGVFTIAGVALTNWATRKGDRREAAETRSQAVRSQLQSIKSDLRGSDKRIALDAVDELRLLAMRVSDLKRYTDEDRDAVWVVMSSRVLQLAAEYPEVRSDDVTVEHPPEVEPPPEGDETVELPPEGGA